VSDGTNFFPRAWGTDSWILACVSWKQDQPRSEIKVFSGCPPLRSTHHLQSKEPFKHCCMLLKSSCPGSYILPLLGFLASKCELKYSLVWTAAPCSCACLPASLDAPLKGGARVGAGCAGSSREVLVPQRGKWLWDLGKYCPFHAVGSRSMSCTQAFPLLIVMQADGPVTARGCDAS